MKYAFNVCSIHIEYTSEVYMIVMIAGVKGGTGKTTIATNLAVMRAAAGKKLLLVDADEQRSTVIWANQRDVLGIETKWTTVSFGGKALRSQVLRMKDDYDDIIIDVGGRETTSLRASLSIAHVCIVPFKPRSLDIWTLGDVKSVVAEMKPANPDLKVFAFINQADAKGSDNEGSQNILDECDEIECIPITIGSRKAFANAASDGLGVTEMKVQDKKAIQEITSLYEFIYNKCTSDVPCKNIKATQGVYGR
jgi:chromosome partitioning protein